MNDQQTDELLALSAILEESITWTHVEHEGRKMVQVRMKIEVEWEEEGEVEVWDWEDREREVEEVVEGVRGIEIEKKEQEVKLEKEKEKAAPEVGKSSSRKRARRRGGGKGAAHQPQSPTSSAPSAAFQRPPASTSTPRSPPHRPPAPAPAPTPKSSSSILTLSLTKSGVPTSKGHTLIHLPTSSSSSSPAPPPNTTIEIETAERGPKKLNLKYLPPLELVVRLGAGYPEKEGPEVSVVDEVGWLGEERVRELEKVLGAVWQPPSESLWLLQDLISHASLLSTLSESLSFPLTLRQHSPSPSSTALSASLLSHQAQKSLTHFNSQSFLCTLCLTSQKGSSCLSLHSCLHTFCLACLSSYFTLLITEGLVRGVACPEQSCTRRRVEWEREWVGKEEAEEGGGQRPGWVGEEELERIVGREGVQRWREMGEKQRVESDPSIAFCPRPTCLTPIPAPLDDPTTNLRLCPIPSCLYAFCQLCRQTWHGSHTPCALPQSGLIVTAWLEGGEEERQGLERRYGRGNVRRLVERWEEERGNREWLEGATKACPGCRVNVEKSQGCSHMCCSRCSTHFCFRCGSRISATEPYKHFSTPGLPCYNKLFEFRAGEEPAVEEWLGDILEEDVREAEREGEVRGEWHGERWNPFV